MDIIYFDDCDARTTISSAEEGGESAGWQRHDDGRLPGVLRSEAYRDKLGGLGKIILQLSFAIRIVPFPS